MSRWVKVVSLQDIPKLGARVVNNQGREIGISDWKMIVYLPSTTNARTRAARCHRALCMATRLHARCTAGKSV